MLKKYIVVCKFGKVWIIESDWYYKENAKYRMLQLNGNNKDSECSVYSQVIK